MKEKTIYNLDLHEGLTLPSGIEILRVPGGWLYDSWDHEKHEAKSGTFVPYHNEFQSRKTGTGPL